MRKYFKFTFADGHIIICAGMDRIELKNETIKHGKLISKTFVC